ncbi:hypothetical protein Aperf_G00000095026 [Anoplocephala perfoliata]
MSEAEDTVSALIETDQVLGDPVGPAILEGFSPKAENDLSSSPDQNDHREVDWTCNRPKLCAIVKDEFSHGGGDKSDFNNYLRGCKWSPDGTCLLTQSNDNVFRIFDFDEINHEEELLTRKPTPRLRVRGYYPVIDYCWYPFMNANDDRTCVFISARERSPIEMLDSETGTVRCTYMPTNLNGELEKVSSIAFSSDGSCIFCGFKRFIKVVNTEYPSAMRRIPEVGEKPRLKGIISAIATPPYNECGNRGLYALGTFEGCVEVYSQGSGKTSVIECANAPSKGISQLKFLSERYLIAGGRVDGVIQVWDLAGTSKEPCLTFHRRVENYQRFQFDVDPTDRYLFTGSQTGAAFCYNFSTGELEFSWRAHEDSCNGMAIHPTSSVLATAAGQRRPLGTPEDSEDDVMPRALIDEEAMRIFASSGDGGLPLRGELHLLPVRNEVRIWKFPYVDQDCG